MHIQPLYLLDLLDLRYAPGRYRKPLYKPALALCPNTNTFFKYCACQLVHTPGSEVYCLQASHREPT